jgi:CoA:oxalate CoA-transferase
VTQPQPLAGLRILALEQLMALPFGTQLLADFGADVISVESIGYTSYESSRWRERTGRHKRRIQVRFNDPRGQDLIRRIAGSVDVLAENFRPGVMDRYGLGWQDLRAENERLIYVSVSGYGHHDFLPSPHSSQAAYGPIGEAMSGAMHAIRGEGGLSSGMALGDITSALFTTIGILVAVAHRDQTGQGQYLDVAMADSLFALAELPFMRYATAQAAASGGAGPVGRRSYVDYPSGVFAAIDGEIQLIIMNDVHWESLCRLLDEPDWITDHDFNDPATRPARIQERALPVFRAWVRARTRREATEQLRAAGIAAAPVNGPADIDRDPHFLARRMIETVQTARGERLRVAGNPIKLSAIEQARDADQAAEPIARPGEHTRRVLQDTFGLAADEIAELERDGVILDTAARAEA